MITGRAPQSQLVSPQVQLLLAKAEHAHFVAKVLVSAVWHCLVMHDCYLSLCPGLVLYHSIVFHAGSMLACANQVSMCCNHIWYFMSLGFSLVPATVGVAALLAQKLLW